MFFEAVSLELYLSVSLINGNRNSKISLQGARADLRRWYHCDRGPYYVGGFYGRPGSIRHRWELISHFQFFGSQKNALVFVGGPPHLPHTSARHLSPTPTRHLPVTPPRPKYTGNLTAKIHREPSKSMQIALQRLQMGLLRLEKTAKSPKIRP